MAAILIGLLLRRRHSGEQTTSGNPEPMNTKLCPWRRRPCSCAPDTALRVCPSMTVKENQRSGSAVANHRQDVALHLHWRDEVAVGDGVAGRAGMRIGEHLDPVFVER